MGPDAIKELRRATDLSLHATKEIACAIGRSMAAMVAMGGSLSIERPVETPIWLNLSEFVSLRGLERLFPALNISQWMVYTGLQFESCSPRFDGILTQWWVMEEEVQSLLEKEAIDTNLPQRETTASTAGIS